MRHRRCNESAYRRWWALPPPADAWLNAVLLHHHLKVDLHAPQHSTAQEDNGCGDPYKATSVICLHLTAGMLESLLSARPLSQCIGWHALCCLNPGGGDALINTAAAGGADTAQWYRHVEDDAVDMSEARQD